MTQTQVRGIAALASAEANPLQKLLKDARRLGGIYHLDYERAVVITDDFQKREAGGVPRHGFLLAAATAPTRETSAGLDEDEVILLRVRGVAQLPHQSDLVATRMAAMRDANVRDQRPADILDPLTSREIETAAFECDVLGTFYPGSVEGKPYIRWGADIDNVYAGVRYFVYAPSVRVLSFIASYPERTEEEVRNGAEPPLIAIGNVRFAATRRRAAVAGMDTAAVKVRVTDFISRKTAILGMTRAGKSNTNKTICTAVFEYSRRTELKIGQLIFDPQGEYANINQQDKTGLRLLGERWVRVYRFGVKTDSEQERPLTLNFYAANELPAARAMVNECLAGQSAKYVEAFKAAEIEPPDAADFPGGAKDSAFYAAKARSERGRFAFYATLAKANFPVPRGWSITVPMAEAMAKTVLVDYAGALAIGKGNVTINSADSLKNVMNWLCQRLAEYAKGKLNAQYQGLDFATWANSDAFNDIRAAYDGTGGTAALNALKGFVEFHSAVSRGDVVDQVHADLSAGRVVIIDLSYGSERVGTVMSERIVRGLLEMANRRFRDNLPTIPIQIVVEEAHRLFDRNKANADERDPWVALAKEAAKYDIGLLYATQEVSAVDRRILSNTHNWIVAHLNSDLETKELGHYYDFAEFGDSIRRAEDVGFARMKTLSGQYIVPVQIAKFDHQMINKARAAAGLEPVDLDKLIVATVPAQPTQLALDGND